MKYYTPIHIENLEVIQKKVFELFPKSELTKNNLFYIPSNVELFLSIPELKTELDRLELTEHIIHFGFYVLQTTSDQCPHIDSGDPVYSFNIPIYNCENTFVNFYTVSSDPVERYLPNGVSYYRVNLQDCKLADSLEMNQPYIINVKQAHCVVNKNPSPRITLLIRLKKEVDLSRLF
jgi:hypothetical protein